MKIGFYGENFIDEASASGSISATRAVQVGGAGGCVYARCVAGAGGASITAEGYVKLTATECATFSGTYENTGLSSQHTFAAATTFNEGETICELGFCSYTELFAKVALTSSGLSGKVKVIPYVR